MVKNALFGKWLLRMLQSRDWSQADLARRIGVSTGTISNWVTGRRVPDTSSCDLIADALSIDLDVVLGQAGHRPMTEPLKPDDPQAEIVGLVRRIDWRNPTNYNVARNLLLTLIGEGKRR